LTPYLLVDDRRVVPEKIARPWSRYRLRLPAREIRLISGAAQPARLNGTDTRKLGVLLRGMRWERDDVSIDVPLGLHSFTDGFHAAERDPDTSEQVCWTTGNAGFPPDVIPKWEGEVLLHLALGEWLGSSQLARHNGAEAILSEFESLGEDCEFGLVQRHYLVEPPLSLYRWAGAPAVTLIEGLETAFAGLDDPTRTDLVWSGREYYLRTPFLSIHTNCTAEVDAAEREELLRCGRATLRILRRKLLKDIADAQRVFVFKAIGAKFGEFEMRRLHGALRGLGPAALLCVKEGPGGGRVEQLDEGLFTANLDRFVIQGGGGYDQWLTICARTLALRGRG
jgi:hypothetical protein